MPVPIGPSGKKLTKTYLLYEDLTRCHHLCTGKMRALIYYTLPRIFFILTYEVYWNLHSLYRSYGDEIVLSLKQCKFAAVGFLYTLLIIKSDTNTRIAVCTTLLHHNAAST